eukprot:8684192-Pyramimonas_sp.AAC.1
MRLRTVARPPMHRGEPSHDMLVILGTRARVHGGILFAGGLGALALRIGIGHVIPELAVAWGSLLDHGARCPLRKLVRVVARGCGGSASCELTV